MAILMPADVQRASEDFLNQLLFLGLTVDDLEETLARKRNENLTRMGVVNKIPAREAFDVFIQNLAYERGHRNQFRAASKTVYQQVLRAFYHYCLTFNAAIEVKDLPQHAVPFLIDIAEKRHFQPATWNKYAAILRTFLRSTAEFYAVDRGILPKYQRLRQALPQALNDEEVRQLLEVAKGTQYGLRAHFMLSFFLGTGLRRDEFRRLRLGDIDTSVPAVLVHGKGGVPRLVVMPSHLTPVLKSYCDIYDIHEPYHYLYGKVRQPSTPISNNTLDDTARRLFRKLPTYSPEDARHRYHLHTLRHTYAVRLLRAGVSLRTIAQVLGHKSVRTTQIYTVLDTETLREQLQPGLDKLSQWW